MGLGGFGSALLSVKKKRGEKKREGLPVLVILLETVVVLDQDDGQIGGEEFAGERDGVEVELLALFGAERSVDWTGCGTESPAGSEDAVEHGSGAAADVFGFVGDDVAESMDDGFHVVGDGRGSVDLVLGVHWLASSPVAADR